MSPIEGSLPGGAPSARTRQKTRTESNYPTDQREDAKIFEQAVGRMAGVKPMPYSKLGEQHAFTPLVRP